MNFTRNVSVSQRNAGEAYDRVVEAIETAPNVSAFIVECIVFYLDFIGNPDALDMSSDLETLSDMIAEKVLQRLQINVHVDAPSKDEIVNAVSPHILENIAANIGNPKGG